ncbi:MAG: sugar ABC transporter substrate-binding protein [Saccharofermentanales bacterium]
MMISSKKVVFLLIASILVISLLFAGCDEKPDDESKVSNVDVKRLTIWDNEANDVLFGAIAEYEADNPDIRITVQTQGETSLEMAISAGTAPDIIMSPSDYMATYGQKKYTLDLTAFGAEDIKPLFTDITWGIANAIPDKIYSIPFDSNIINFAINRDMFDNAGATVPVNFDEMLVAANKIKSYHGSDSGYYAYTAPFDSLTSVGYKAWGTFHYYWWLWRMGGDIFTEDGSDTRINDSVAVETLQMLVDLKRNGLAPADYKLWDFIDGKVAMVEMTTRDFFVYTLTAQTGNYEVAMMPKLKEDVDPITGMGLYCYAVTSGSKLPQEAYDFIKYYCTNVDYQITYCKPSYFIPSLIEAQEDSYFKTADWTIILEQAKYAKATPGVNNWQAMDDAVYDAIQLAVNGTKTPQAALDAAAETIRQLMD